MRMHTLQATILQLTSIRKNSARHVHSKFADSSVLHFGVALYTVTNKLWKMCVPFVKIGHTTTLAFTQIIMHDEMTYPEPMSNPSKS